MRLARTSVGGDSENESCRIRFGSESREEPAERGVLQAAGRFITRRSLYLTPTHTPTPCSRKDGRLLD